MKICLDAGHAGAYNRSPAVPAYYESHVMWKLHLMLKASLEKLGIEVVTTRANRDVDLALETRGRAAKGCDLFISLHSNATGSAKNDSVDYPLACVYSPDDKTGIDEISRDIGLKLATCVATTMATTQGARTLLKKTDFDRDKNGYLDDEWYGVLHGAKQVKVPGVLLEHSFHTNTRATKWLLDDANLQRLADAEAECIAAHFNIAKKLYRVQTGAFRNRAGALKLQEDLQKQNLQSFVVKVGDLYKVQLGAFSIKANADAYAIKIKQLGFDCFVTQ